MSEKRYKRFYVSESENQLTIYDNEGLDDYYHLGNDKRDVKGICKLLNEQQSKIIELQEIIIELKDDKNQLHKVISKLRQEVAELKTRNAVLYSKLNRIPKSIKEVWLE